MKSKGEILKEIDKIKLNYSRGNFKIFNNFDVVIKNFDYLIEYFETNDLWKKLCLALTNYYFTCACLLLLLRVLNIMLLKN